MNALDTATAPLVEIMVEAGMPLEGVAAMAESIARELYRKSATWLADHPDEVAEIFTA